MTPRSFCASAAQVNSKKQIVMVRRRRKRDVLAGVNATTNFMNPSFNAEIDDEDSIDKR
jgi:hypothetical protein